MIALTSLIQALAVAAWPLIVFYVIWTYRKQVAEVIESAKNRRFTIKVGGQELSMEEANQQQQKLIEDLQQQLNELKKQTEGSAIAPANILNKESARGPETNSILWVDDNPRNNSYFIDFLQKRGYRVDLASGTNDALRMAAQSPYRLILSDMGRDEGGSYNREAGLDLLAGLKQQAAEVPFVIFCSQQAAQRYRDRARELGARAITSSGTELRAILDEFAPAPAV